MFCNALLCGRFDDYQESRFQASKRSNMCSSVLESVLSAAIHEFCFDAAKRSDMDLSKYKGVYLLNVSNGIFRQRKV